METSLVGILKTGSASMWIIIACSVIALAVALERAIALWGFTAKAKSLADAVTRALYRGDLDDGRAQCERSGSPAADVFLAGLVAASPRPGARPRRAAGAEKIAAAVERERQQVNLKLRREPLDPRHRRRHRAVRRPLRHRGRHHARLPADGGHRAGRLRGGGVRHLRGARRPPPAASRWPSRRW